MLSTLNARGTHFRTRYIIIFATNCQLFMNRSLPYHPVVFCACFYLPPKSHNPTITTTESQPTARHPLARSVTKFSYPFVPLRNRGKHSPCWAVIYMLGVFIINPHRMDRLDSGRSVGRLIDTHTKGLIPRSLLFHLLTHSNNSF